MPDPLWTILIPTIGRRGDMLTELMDCLLPQTEPYGGRVTVLALWNNGERRLPEYRDMLMDAATSEYTSFVDDDDKLPPYFVEKIVPLLDGVDYVGWRMQMYWNGDKISKPTYHSLAYGCWNETSTAHVRDISHLNPVRRQIAAEHARFDRLGTWVFEDTNWAEMIRPYVKSEHCVPAEHCMYFYMRTGDSAWRGFPPPPPGLFKRPVIEHPNFSWLEDA